MREKKHLAQVSLTEYDDRIKAFPSDRSDVRHAHGAKAAFLYWFAIFVCRFS
jgi:hypothetical protein